MLDDELDALVAEVRRQWGDRFPLPGRDESTAERDQREQLTRELLTRTVLPELDQQRMHGRLQPLTGDEQDALVDLVGSEMFGLPRLLTVLRDPGVTDVLVFGCDQVRVERIDGTQQLLPPLVRRDRDLERIIYDTATSRRRPFNREHPFVDLELEPHRPGVQLCAERPPDGGLIARPIPPRHRKRLYHRARKHDVAGLQGLALIGQCRRQPDKSPLGPTEDQRRGQARASPGGGLLCSGLRGPKRFS